jgi:aryl-alcohol dehydrogenase-like predicted oxidoreductase
MKIKQLGRTGLRVSEICLGTMTFGHQCDEAASFAIMDQAAELGVDFIDVADVYPVPVSLDTVGRTEEIVGKWLENGKRRHKFILATKCRHPMGPLPNDGGLSRKHVIEACHASLRRLRTDCIDLYQVHAPDPATPIEETLSALDSLVRDGKVRYIGCSNFLAWQLGLAIAASNRGGWARFDCVQPRYNMLTRDIESDLLPLCGNQGIGVIAYNPLAGGLLTGKYSAIPSASVAPPEKTRFSLGGSSGTLYRNRYWHDEELQTVSELSAWFLARGKSLAQAAVAWLLCRPELTSAIVGATSAAQLAQTLPAVDLALDAEEMSACDAAWYKIPRRAPQK